MDERVIEEAVKGWEVECMERATVASDTRQLEVVLVRLRSPALTGSLATSPATRWLR
jgi:hypothetical protein